MANKWSKETSGTAAAVFIGYLAACFVPACSLVLLSFFQLPEQPGLRTLSWDYVLGCLGALGAIFGIALLAALPGFILLRFALHRLRRTDWPSFMLAGAVNAYLALIVFSGPSGFSLSALIHNPPLPITGVLGGMAGLTYRAVERRMTQRSRARLPRADKG